jgi:hypothetical protein
VCRANFSGSANFNEAVFRDAVTFSGWRNVTVQIAGVAMGIATGVVATTTGAAEPSAWRRVRARCGRARIYVRNLVRRSTRLLQAMLGYLRVRIASLQRRFAGIDPNTRLFGVFEGEGQFQEVILSKPELSAGSTNVIHRFVFGQRCVESVSCGAVSRFAFTRWDASFGPVDRYNIQNAGADSGGYRSLCVARANKKALSLSSGCLKRFSGGAAPGAPLSLVTVPSRWAC